MANENRREGDQRPIERATTCYLGLTTSEKASGNFGGDKPDCLTIRQRATLQLFRQTRLHEHPSAKDMLHLLAKYMLNKAGYAQLGVFWGYARASGWAKSLTTNKPIDSKGDPLPWYTYSCIHFIESRFSDSAKLFRPRVFEFGSGNSTLWWARRASRVVSVEDNRDWHQYITQGKPNNVIYKFAADKDSYLNALLQESDLFDAIIIDGSFREACIAESPRMLNSKGVIIIDNSDWEDIKPSMLFLKSEGFRQLEFYSMGPVNGHPWGTSIFYKKDNILDI